MLTIDQIKNFSKGILLQGYTATDTTISFIPNDGLKFPDPTSGAYNVVWWNNTDYADPADDPEVEIVRVVAGVGDVKTILRGQEGTTATDKNIPNKTYKMVLSLTTKMIYDIVNQAGVGTVTAGANEGGGFEIFDTVNSDAQTLVFKTITAGANITIVDNGTSISISATGGGGGGGYDLVQNNGVSVTQETTLNLSPLLTASDVASKTFITINTTNLANDATFLTALTNNSTFQTNVNTFVSASGGNSYAFTYGEPISLNDYVWQSMGTENSARNAQLVAGAQDLIPLSNFLVGNVFVGLPGGNAIGNITVQLAKQGSPTGNMVMKIYAQSGGIPTGAALATSNNFNVATLTGSFVNTAFVFGTPFVPTIGTQYIFILDSTGVTYPGGSGVKYTNASFATGLGRVYSNDGGSTWNQLTTSVYYVIGNNFEAYKVYLTDPNYINEGAYKGFASANGVYGDVKNVYLGGVADTFTSLVIKESVYIDPTVRGGTIQTIAGAGRAIGVAVSPTGIQLVPPKRRGAIRSYTFGTVVGQDGFLMFNVNGGGVGNSFSLSETDQLGNSTVVVTNFFPSGGGGGGGNITNTIPVKAGYIYTAATNLTTVSNLQFMPIING